MTITFDSLILLVIAAVKALFHSAYSLRDIDFPNSYISDTSGKYEIFIAPLRPKNSLH